MFEFCFGVDSVTRKGALENGDCGGAGARATRGAVQGAGSGHRGQRGAVRSCGGPGVLQRQGGGTLLRAQLWRSGCRGGVRACSFVMLCHVT